MLSGSWLHPKQIASLGNFPRSDLSRDSTHLCDDIYLYFLSMSLEKKGQEWLRERTQDFSNSSLLLAVYYMSACYSKPCNFSKFYIPDCLSNSAKAEPTLTMLYPEVKLHLEKWRWSWHSLKTFLRNLSHLTTVSGQMFTLFSMTKRKTDQSDQVQTLSMPWLHSKKNW